MDDLFELAYTVRPHETNYRETAPPGVLLNYMQDAAFAHSTAAGVSVFDLFKKNLTWVLSRYAIALDRLPASGEEVRVRSWYSGRQRQFHLRDFEVTDGSGRPLAKATSSWLIIDMATRRPASDDHLLDGFPVREVRVLDDPFDPLPVPENPEVERRFPVRFTDVDPNRHVNHVQHVSWALESVPPKLLFLSRPARIEIAYRSEIRYGDTAVARTAAGGTGEYLHQIFREADGTEVARARTAWV